MAHNMPNLELYNGETAIYDDEIGFYRREEDERIIGFRRQASLAPQPIEPLSDDALLGHGVYMGNTPESTDAYANLAWKFYKVELVLPDVSDGEIFVVRSLYKTMARAGWLQTRHGIDLDTAYDELFDGKKLIIWKPQLFYRLGSLVQGMNWPHGARYGLWRDAGQPLVPVNANAPDIDTPAKTKTSAT